MMVPIWDFFLHWCMSFTMFLKATFILSIIFTEDSFSSSTDFKQPPEIYNFRQNNV